MIQVILWLWYIRDRIKIPAHGLETEIVKFNGNKSSLSVYNNIKYNHNEFAVNYSSGSTSECYHGCITLNGHGLTESGIYLYDK